MISRHLAQGLLRLMETDQTDFCALVALAGLDPSTAFRGADLRSVDLTDQDLTAFDFTDADFDGAILVGTRFSADGVRKEQLQGCLIRDSFIGENSLTGRVGIPLPQDRKQAFALLPKLPNVTARTALAMSLSPLRTEGEVEQVTACAPSAPVSVVLTAQPISTLSFVTGLPNLQSLYLSFSEISDVTALKDLAQLQSLYLRETNISDVSALKDMTQLQSLYLRETNISDVSALKDLTQLQSLDLSNTNISDVSALKDLAQLQSLYLRKTKISDVGSVLQRRFSRLVLMGADLIELDLTGADLRGADLRGADLTEADLRGASCSGMRIDSARLHDADFTNATGLTQAQIDRAEGNAGTKLPDDLHHPAHWDTDDVNLRRKNSP